MAITSAARADVFEFTFSGTIDDGPGMTLPGDIGAITGGEEFIFKYVFLGSQSDGNPAGDLGVYQMLSSSLTINDATLFSPPGGGGQIEVRLDQNIPFAGGGDIYDVYTALASFDEENGFVLLDLNVMWPAGQWATDGLPTDLEPPAFVGGTMGLSNLSGLMTATVTDFSVSKVPGPGGLAVVAIAGLWRRRRRRDSAC
jgi:MYXO-CTERM domain-containing protein